MEPIIKAAVVGILEGAFTIWAQHAGKPAGWKPSPQEIADLLAKVDADTPAAIEAEVRAEETGSA